MKKRTLLLAAAGAILLAGCAPVQTVAEPTPAVQTAHTALTPTATAEPTPEETGPAPAVPTAAPTPEPTPEPTPAPTPEPPRRPSDEEVLAAYGQAVEAYGWFDLTTLPLDFTQPKTVGELTYYPVADDRFPTMDSLQAYLKGLFSDEIVDGLLPLDGEHYREIDGVLCAADAARGSDLTKGEITYCVVWPEGEPVSCTLRAEVEVLDEADLTTVTGAQVYEFPYQKVGEKWVFTHFESIF